MTAMTLKPRGDREIVVVRAFNAPRDWCSTPSASPSW